MSSPESSTSTPTEIDLTGPAAEVARLKRQLAASENRLAEVTNTRPKKTACVFLLCDNILVQIFLRSVKNMGRGIRKIVSLFENLASILDEADRRIVEQEDCISATERAGSTEDAEDIQRA